MARIVSKKAYPAPAATFKDAVRAVGGNVMLEVTAEELVAVVAVLAGIGGSPLSARAHTQQVSGAVRQAFPQVDFIEVFRDICLSKNDAICLRDLEV